MRIDDEAALPTPNWPASRRSSRPSECMNSDGDGNGNGNGWHPKLKRAEMKKGRGKEGKLAARGR